MTRPPRLPTLFLLSALALAGCDRGEDLPPDAAGAAPPPAGPPPLAVARCRVDVEGGLVRLAAQREGTIRDVLVEEGDRVAAGQVLARVDPRQAEVRVETARAELAEAEAQVPVVAARLALAEREAARRRGAGAAVPVRAVDEAQTDVAVLRAELGAARAAAVTAARRLDEALYEVEARTVRAPVAGRIVKRSATPGNGTSTQTVTELFQLLPEAERIARCELEEAFVDLVRPGLAAEIVRETDEGPRWPATVRRIADVFGAPRPTDDPTERRDVRVVEMVLTLGPDVPLRIGQRVLARIQEP